MDPCCSRVNCRKCWLLKGGKVARFPQDCWEVKRTMRRWFTEWDRVGWLIPFRLYSLCLESLGEDKIHSALQTSLHNLTTWLIPGVLQSTELQRVGHNWTTELKSSDLRLRNYHMAQGMSSAIPVHSVITGWTNPIIFFLGTLNVKYTRYWI